MAKTKCTINATASFLLASSLVSVFYDPWVILIIGTWSSLSMRYFTLRISFPMGIDKNYWYVSVALSMRYLSVLGLVISEPLHKIYRLLLRQTFLVKVSDSHEWHLQFGWHC